MLGVHSVRVHKNQHVDFVQRAQFQHVLEKSLAMTHFLPPEKLQAMHTLLAELKDDTMPKRLGFITRHSTELLWPKSVLQVAVRTFILPSVIS